MSGIKDNFPGLYNQAISCDLCGEIDRQEHLMECPKLNTHEDNNSHIKYSHIFGSVIEQRDVTILFGKLLDERNKLLEKANLGIVQDHPTFCI